MIVMRRDGVCAFVILIHLISMTSLRLTVDSVLTCGSTGFQIVWMDAIYLPSIGYDRARQALECGQELTDWLKIY